MAQVEVRVGITEIGPLQRRTSRLFRITSNGFASAFRKSRERDELGMATSLARTGRETGVKC
jgi:hypothetical protein